MPADFQGNWNNQRGSTLELVISENVVSGRFESGVGDNGEVLWVDVSGRVLNDLITFNALYPEYGTVVSWVGQLAVDTDGTEVIETHWVHATDIPDSQEQGWMWYSNRIGADIFRRA